jgi:hypothetical protein
MENGNKNYSQPLDIKPVAIGAVAVPAETSPVL